MKILVDMNLSPEWLAVLAQAGTPSVVLLRLRNELDSAQQARVCALLRTVTAALEAGALLVIAEHRARLRRLPVETGGEA